MTDTQKFQKKKIAELAVGDRFHIGEPIYVVTRVEPSALKFWFHAEGESGIESFKLTKDVEISVLVEESHPATS